ncbi:MAG: hypothetical protein SGPRY_003072 [Prymnesium sp.]
MSSWIQGGIAAARVAGQLLEKADKRCEQIAKVTERSGPPPRASSDTEEAAENPPSASCCAHQSSTAPMSLPNDHPPPSLHTTPSRGGADGEGRALSLAEGQHRRARLAEWEGLAREIEDLSSQGHQLGRRLSECTFALDKSRSSEAQARGQLQEALSEQHALRAALEKARGDAEQVSLSAREGQQSALRELERRLAQSEASLAGERERVAGAEAAVAAAKRAEGEARKREDMAVEALASVEQAAAMEQAAAEAAAEAVLARALAAEEREASLVSRNQELAEALGGQAKGDEARLEGELTQAAAEKRQAEGALLLVREELAGVLREREVLRVEVGEMTRVAEGAKWSLDDANKRAETMRVELEALRAQGAEKEAAAKSEAIANGVRDELESRVGRLAEQLAERSSQLQAVASERTALRHQLQNETRRRLALEQQPGVGEAREVRESVRVDVVPSVTRGKESTGRLPKLVELVQANVVQPRAGLLDAAKWADEGLHLVDRLALQVRR